MNYQFDTPEQIGLDLKYWNAVTDKLEGWCQSGQIPAATLIAGRSNQMTTPLFFGHQTPAPDSTPLKDDSIFLIASITKPIVAMGIMKLVEQGELLLSERVHRLIPEFGNSGKYQITVRHLLTHTSGLPDMLTNNIELRQKHSPLIEFVKETSKADRFFEAGHASRYQSMGFAVLGQIILNITGKSCSDFLRDEFFSPLEMNDTELGAPDLWYVGDNPIINRVAQSSPPVEFGDCEDWGWNSKYWQQLGAPWGGLFTTPVDLARYSQMMLQKGTLNQTRVLGQATIETSTRNHLPGIKNLPEEEQRLFPWGLGWRMSWPGSSWNMGDLLSPSTYGHWGATGTVLWIDPEKDAFAIVLTTQPSPRSYDHIARISNMLAAAFSQ
jgi:CubicO group peptidase (beta-lactamase class C family)